MLVDVERNGDARVAKDAAKSMSAQVSPRSSEIRRPLKRAISTRMRPCDGQASSSSTGVGEDPAAATGEAKHALQRWKRWASWVRGWRSPAATIASKRALQRAATVSKPSRGEAGTRPASKAAISTSRARGAAAR